MIPNKLALLAECREVLEEVMEDCMKTKAAWIGLPLEVIKQDSAYNHWYGVLAKLDRILG